MLRKVVIAAVLMISFGASAEPELKGSPKELKGFLHPPEKLITLTQTAEQIAFKDVAIVSLSVTTEDDKLAVALRKNSEQREQVSLVLAAAGIEPKDVKSSRFSTSPDYGWFGDKPDSYKVSNVLTIRINNEQELTSIASVVDEHRAVTLMGTDYEHSDKETFADKVKELALEKVLKEKAFYEKKLGLKLQAVSFSGNGVSPHDEVEVIEVSGVRGSSMQRDYLSKSKLSAPMTFEKVIYKSTVSVSYRVL